MKKLLKLKEIYNEMFPNDNRIAMAIDALENDGDIYHAAQMMEAASNQALWGRCFVGDRIISVYEGCRVDLWVYRRAACAAAAIEHYCMAAMPHNSGKANGLKAQADRYSEAAINWEV